MQIFQIYETFSIPVGIPTNLRDLFQRPVPHRAIIMVGFVKSMNLTKILWTLSGCGE